MRGEPQTLDGAALMYFLGLGQRHTLAARQPPPQQSLTDFLNPKASQ